MNRDHRLDKAVHDLERQKRREQPSGEYQQHFSECIGAGQPLSADFVPMFDSATYPSSMGRVHYVPLPIHAPMLVLRAQMIVDAAAYVVSAGTPVPPGLIGGAVYRVDKQQLIASSDPSKPINMKAVAKMGSSTLADSTAASFLTFTAPRAVPLDPKNQYFFGFYAPDNVLTVYCPGAPGSGFTRLGPLGAHQGEVTNGFQPTTIARPRGIDRPYVAFYSELGTRLFAGPI